MNVLRWNKIIKDSLREDHPSNFKVIYSMINLQLMGSNIKYEATFQELSEKSPTSGKKKMKLMLEIEKKESKN